MRQRLTTRVAEDLTVQGRGATKESKGSGIDNDVYDMNDTGHEKNDPSREEYAKGDPSSWAEDPNMKDPAADDSKREETGHAPLIDKHKYATEAIANVRRLEEKAVRAIVASQRALPGATKQDIEQQAAAFMHMPDECLNGTLARQEKLAREIVGAAEKSVEDAEAPTEGAAEAPAEAAEDKEAAKEEAPAEAEASDDKEAKKEEKKDDEDLPEFLQKKLASMAAELAKEMVKEAAKKGVSSVNTNDPAMNISNASEEEPKETEEAEEKAEEAEEGEKAEEKAEEAEEKAEEKDASNDITFGDDDGEAKDANDDLLSQIFSNVTASTEKKGASKLSGLVKKQASEGGSADLESILMSGTPPDINHLFQQ